MKITSVKPYLVHPGWRKNWLFVKVETDSGLHGWGEAYTQADRDRTTAIHVEELERYLVGRDPFNIKHFTQIAYDDYGQRRGSMEIFSAVSGVEQAMWDIVGKALGEPVYRLLGGACRDRVRVYANGWYWGAETEDDFARAAERVVEKGFTALKFDALTGPWRSYVDSRQIDAAAKKVRRVRNVVGPDVDMLIEIHRRLAPMYAVQLAQQIAEFRPYWFEEPCPAEKPRRPGGDSPADFNTGRHGRGDLRQGRICAGLRKAGRRHHQPGRCEHRRNPGVEGDCRNGRAALRGRLAAQLQLDGHGAGVHRSRIRRHAQLPDHRVLRPVRRDRHAGLGPASAGERVHPPAGHSRPRCGHKPRRPRGVRIPPLPGKDPADAGR